MKGINKNSELYEQMKFYIAKTFNKNIDDISKIQIDRAGVQYTYKNEKIRFPVPYQEWLHDKTTPDCEIYNDSRKRRNMLRGLVWQLTEELTENYKEKGYEFTYEGQNSLMIKGKHLPTGKEFQKQIELIDLLLKDEMETQYYLTLFSNKLKGLVDSLDRYLGERQYVKEHEEEILNELIVDLAHSMSNVVYVNKNNELFVKVYQEKFPVDKKILLNIVHGLTYDFIYDNKNNILKVKISYDNKMKFVERAKFAFEQKLFYKLSDYPNIKKAAINFDNYFSKYTSLVFCGYEYKPVQEYEEFYICYFANIFILEMETEFGHLTYMNNNFVAEANHTDINKAALFSDEYKEAFKFATKLFEKYIDKMEFVSGEGLINGNTFLWIKKEKPVLFSVNICSCKHLSDWKSQIQGYAKQIKQCIEKTDKYGDKTLNMGLRTRPKYFYGSFLMQDIVLLIDENKNISEDEIIDNLVEGIKHKDIRDIEHSGLYCDFMREEIQERLKNLVELGYVSCDEYNFYQTNRSYKMLFCQEIFEEYFEYISKQKPYFNCYELEYLMNKKKALNEWLFYTLVFHNREFLCIYKEKVLQSWEKADDMVKQILEMRYKNKEFESRIAEEVIKEILKKKS